MVCRSCQNTFHLFYRMDLFEKHELDVPTTFDEVMDACEVLKGEAEHRLALHHEPARRLGLGDRVHALHPFLRRQVLE